MICSHCASQMPEISAFCPGCGRPIRSEHEYLSSADARDALLGALAYWAILPAVLLLAVPAFKSSRFVRFHSWQSIFFAVTTAAAGFAMKLFFAAFSMIPLIGFLFAWLSAGVLFLAVVILWAVLVVKAGQGQSYELPWIGPMAAQLAD
jgi:uncharacterized membrane protein